MPACVAENGCNYAELSATTRTSAYYQMNGQTPPNQSGRAPHTSYRNNMSQQYVVTYTNIVAIIAKAYFRFFPLFFAITPPLNFAKLQFCEVDYILILSPVDCQCHGFDTEPCKTVSHETDLARPGLAGLFHMIGHVCCSGGLISFQRGSPVDSSAYHSLRHRH